MARLVGWVVTSRPPADPHERGAVPRLDHRRPRSLVRFGEPRVRRRFFRAISFVALVIGGFLYLVASASRAMSVALAVPPLPFVGIAAVFMATAYFYSYDEYAYPTLIRISEVSTVSDWWLGLLALGAIAAALGRLAQATRSGCSPKERFSSSSPPGSSPSAPGGRPPVRSAAWSGSRRPSGSTSTAAEVVDGHRPRRQADDRHRRRVRHRRRDRPRAGRRGRRGHARRPRHRGRVERRRRHRDSTATAPRRAGSTSPTATRSPRSSPRGTARCTCSSTTPA